MGEIHSWRTYGGLPTTTSKPPLLEDLGKAACQSKALGMDGRVGDDAVADADAVVEAGERLALAGRS